MHDIFVSRRWHYRILRIAVLSLIAWWLITQSGFFFARAGQSLEKAWPRTDFSKRIVQLSEIQPGGPPKDGIPAIDKPRFVSVNEASTWLHRQEPVIVVEKNKSVRAYPLQILIYHEIVNDEIAGLPISVTFCPLCNASIVFLRRIRNQVLDFGTTGRLRKSDLVMYDRQTESWWQQFTGQAIVGKYAGTKLIQIPSKIVAFGDYLKAYPHGEVLSRKTGYSRPYGRNPYRGYDRVGQIPFLFNDSVDKRLPAMARVISVSHAGRHKIYPFSALRGTGVLNDKVAGLPIVIFHKKNLLSVLDNSIISRSRKIQAVTAFDRRVGKLILHFKIENGRILDRQTGSEWDLLGRATKGPLHSLQLRAVNSGSHFAFAWLAFNPDTAIYTNDKITVK